MERAFKLEGGQRHHDDATSVAAWVEECMGDDNAVLHYKPQGADDDKTGRQSQIHIPPWQGNTAPCT